MALLMPKGLSTAVILTLALTFAAAHPALLAPEVAATMADLGFSVMLASILLSVAGPPLLARRASWRATASSPPDAGEEAGPLRQKMMEAAFDWWRRQ
jgi:hypothetical protein